MATLIPLAWNAMGQLDTCTKIRQMQGRPCRPCFYDPAKDVVYYVGKASRTGDGIWLLHLFLALLRKNKDGRAISYGDGVMAGDGDGDGDAIVAAIAAEKRTPRTSPYS